MATPPLRKKQVVEALDMLRRHGSATKAADALGIPRQTFQNRVRRANDILGSSNEAEPEDKRPEQQMRERIYELEGQLRSSKQSTLTDEYVKSKIIGLTESVDELKPPPWTVRTVKEAKALPGVPVTVWSDWHWGEVVFKGQVGGVNEFNLAIAHDRARRLVERTIYLLRSHVVNPRFPGIVLNLGGDMLTGDIHDELTDTNEVPNMVALLDLFGVLQWSITTLADEFGNVFLPCVSGNHGRNTKKMRAKNRNFTNFDWLLYQFLARAFESDKRVQFYIPEGPDALYRVYGHRYLLTHGDQFRGGDGMIGHFGPVLRGQKKKLSRNANIGQEFDTMIHGHFHTYFPTLRVIGNGSLKGYDEFAANMLNAEYEPPIQALWLTHPEHGPTISLPVYLEPHAGRVSSPEWISWRGDREAA